MSEDKLDLQKAENICRSNEKAIEGTAAMKDPKSGEVDAVNFRKSKQNYLQQGIHNLPRSNILKKYVNSVVSTIIRDVSFVQHGITFAKDVPKGITLVAVVYAREEMLLVTLRQKLKERLIHYSWDQLLETTKATLLTYLCRLKWAT